LKGLDTNVLVRFLMRDDEQQWQIADQYINEALQAIGLSNNGSEPFM